jgi:cation:H+ antiporter
MHNLLLNLFGFLTCAAVIIFSGSKLSYYGEKIADLTGLGKAWVGLFLMAAVTSLPELITGISSVAIIKETDLAAGDVFGSCVFNLLLLSVLDARIKKPLFSLVKSSHIVAVIFGIISLMVAGMAIYLADVIPTILWMSSFTFILFGLYLITTWGIFKYEHSSEIEPPAKNVARTSSRSAELKKTIEGYSLHAFIVSTAAVFLPYFGDNIAAQTGLANSFFATLFIAAATSLPELVVSLTALKRGALDLAVGNLLGSNVFNMFILGIDDVFYRQGSFFKSISTSHLFSVFITIIMTAIVGLGLLFKPKKKHMWLLSVDTFVILVLYIILVVYLYMNE